jgi:hypothetical protein
MGLFKHDSKARVDRLVLHLGYTAQMLRSGVVGVSMKDELRTLRKAIDDVIDDDELCDSTWVQHELGLASAS